MGKGSGEGRNGQESIGKPVKLGETGIFKGPRPMCIIALGWSIPRPLSRLTTTAGRAQDSSLTRSAVKDASLPSSLPPRLRNPAIPIPLSSPIHKLCWVTASPFFLAGFTLLCLCKKPETRKKLSQGLVTNLSSLLLPMQGSPTQTFKETYTNI